MNWLRIGDNVMCPICAHNGWCMVSDDNKYICCARVKSPIKLGEAGYVHSYKDILNIHPQRVSFDPNHYLKVWGNANMVLPDYLHHIWGVSLNSIKAFGARWDEHKKCYLFPMWDGINNLIGIQERYLTGEKKATAGSKLGLFVSTRSFKTHNYLIITEGVSDAVVLSEDTYWPIIARPSCSTGASHIKDFLNQYSNIEVVVIVADNDEVGLDGAYNLAKALEYTLKHITCRVIEPYKGCKDVREMKKNNPGYYQNFLQLLQKCTTL